MSKQKTDGRATSFASLVLAAFVCATSSSDSTILDAVQSNADQASTTKENRPDLRADLERSKLTSGQTELLSLRVREIQTDEMFADGLLLNIQADAVTARSFETDTEAWTSNATFALHRIQIGIEHGILYIAPVDADDGTEADDSPRKECSIARLRLADGTWLSPLRVPPAGVKHQRDGADVLNGEVRAILTVGDSLVTLSDAWAIHSNQLVGYLVTRFDASTGAVEWSQAFDYTEAQANKYSHSETKNPVIDFDDVLTSAGDEIVVCDRRWGDIICLSAETGDELWQIPRIWEFRRLYTGAGDFYIDLTRFGAFPGSFYLGMLSEDDFQAEQGDDENARKKYEEQKAKFKQAREFMDLADASIKQGPIVVPAAPGEDFRIYVGVRFGEGFPWGHRAVEDEEIIYEVSAEGKVTRMSYVPYGFPNDDCDVWEGQLAWEAAGGQMRISPTEEHYFDEKRIAFEYFCNRYETTSFANMKKFTSEERPRSVTTSGVVIRPDGAGYVGADSVKFPLVLQNLRSGEVKELILTAPHDGEFGKPIDDYNQLKERPLTSHQFILQHADVHEDRLSLTVKTATKNFAIEFDLADVLSIVGTKNDETH